MCRPAIDYEDLVILLAAGHGLHGIIVVRAENRSTQRCRNPQANLGRR